MAFTFLSFCSPIFVMDFIYKIVCLTHFNTLTHSILIENANLR